MISSFFETNGRGYEQWRITELRCTPRAELAARRNIEHTTNPAIAYEPLLQAGIIIFIRFN